MLTIITLSAFACSAMLETCRYLAMAKIGDWIDKTATPDLIVRSIRLTSVQSSTSSGEAIRDLGVIKISLQEMVYFHCSIPMVANLPC